MPLGQGSSRRACPFTESLRSRFEPHACAQKCSQKSVFIKTCTLNMHFPSVASRGESSQNVCFALGLQQMEQQAQSSKKQAQRRKKCLRQGRAISIAWTKPTCSKQNRKQSRVERARSPGESSQKRGKQAKSRGKTV